MSRIRTVKPSFFKSLTITALPFRARITFLGLLTMADDEGRLFYDPRLVKADVWSLDDDVTAGDVEEDIRALTECSLIAHYTIGEGSRERQYLAVNSWHEHQRINRPTPSTLPAPESGVAAGQRLVLLDSVSPHGAISEDSRGERNKEGKGKELFLSKPDGSDAVDIRPDVQLVIDCMSECLTANGVKSKAGKTWHDAARLMIDRDGYTVEQITWLIRWATSDSFWKANILSLPKFREKFDQLRIKAMAKREAKQLEQPVPSYWQEAGAIG